MKHLSRPQPNKSLIGEGCYRLGKTFLTSLVNNLWAAGGFRVNSSSGEGGLISFPLLLQFLNSLTESANDYLPPKH